MNSKHKFGKKVTSIVLSLTTSVWLAGFGVLAPVAVHAQTVEDLQAQIQSLLALVASLQAQISSLPSSGGAPVGASCTFTRDLTLDVSGADVQCLQRYLNGAGFTLASSGAGSPGSETQFFGPLTRDGVSRWQAGNSVFPSVGYFGPISRSKYNSLVAALPPPAPTPPGTPPTVPGTPTTIPAPAGTLKVEAGLQPSASLFPMNSVRVPFTVVRFTAPADQDVTVDSVVIERVGLASNTAFDGVVLLDENMDQIGVAKTLNSSNQATLTKDFVIRAGTSRTLSLAGNAQTSAGSLGGQLAGLSLVSVNASVPVQAALPISGTQHTVNETLTIGSVTMVRGSLDPGASATKKVGTSDYTFSAVKVTAGSAEKLYLKSVRWHQTGSAGTDDLANIKTYVDGKAYEHSVSSDGKFYTASFVEENGGKGILIDKGFSKEMSIKGDILDGSGRTVDFDIAKRNDIFIEGQTFGYAIKPPATGSSVPTADTAAFSSSEDPWYDAAQVTIATGSISVSNSNTVPAQNIAINVADQPLGAFLVTVKGEDVSVGRVGFNVSFDTIDSGEDVDDITNVVLVDEGGNVIAGPVDGTAADSANTSGAGHGSVVFTDTIIFPVGENIYQLKGKVGTDLNNNSTVQASTTPSNDFATVTGQITGNTITPSPTSAISLNLMTVKTGALNLSVSSVPIAQTIIAGASDFLFANYVLDATGSGEDIRMTSIPLEYNVGGGGSASDVTDCKLSDGSSVVTSAKNPTAAASGTSFTFLGGGLVIPKGTAKTLTMTCDLITGATGTYEWGIDGAQTTFTGATGLTSGQTIVETITDSEGQLMTAATGGSLTIALDSSSPGYQVVNANQTGVTLAKYRYSATNEDVDIRQVALQLTTTASNTPINLVGRTVTLWADGAQIGTAVFATTDWATSSAIAVGDFKVPKDGSKILTVKGDVANISVSGPMTFSGDLLKVDYDGGNVGLNGNYGTGAASGSTISGGTTDTAVTGTRIFKAYPKFAHIPLSTSERALTAGTTADKTLYKFSVTAVGGDVALYKFSFSISSSTAPAGQAGATTSLHSLYSFTTDSTFSTPDTSFSSDGLLNAQQCHRMGGIRNSEDGNDDLIGNGAGEVNGAAPSAEIFIDKSATGCNTATATTTYTVPSGQTYYFRLAATVATVESATGVESFQVGLLGDAAFPTAHQAGPTYTGDMGPVGLAGGNATQGVDDQANDDFIWSPISTTTAITVGDLDYTNGYLLPGLPTVNMPLETFTSPN
jgi:hypothetical protein